MAAQPGTGLARQPHAGLVAGFAGPSSPGPVCAGSNWRALVPLGLSELGVSSVPFSAGTFASARWQRGAVIPWGFPPRWDLMSRGRSCRAGGSGDRGRPRINGGAAGGPSGLGCHTGWSWHGMGREVPWVVPSGGPIGWSSLQLGDAAGEGESRRGGGRC